MALKLSEGFDKISSVLDLSQANYLFAGTVNVNTNLGRFGGGSAMVQNSTSNNLYLTHPAMDIQNGVGHWAFWVKVSDLPASEVDFILMGDTAGSSSSSVRLRINASGDLLIRDYGSPFSGLNAAGVLVDLDWHHIEVAYVAKNSGGSYQVWVDGVSAITKSGDTMELGTPTAVAFFCVLGQTSMTTYIDDVVIWDETGSDFVTAHLDEHRIETRTAEADGTSDFTPSTGGDNYAMVDDANGSDLDSTYVQSTGVGDVDLYDLVPLGRTPVAVHGIAVKTVAKKTDTGDVTMHHRIKTGGADFEGADKALVVTYFTYVDFWGKNPDTTTSWTPSDIDNLQFGFEYQA